MSQLLSTDAAAPGERLAYWIDIICATYVQLECEAQTEAPFRGSILCHALPGLVLSVVNSRAQCVSRTPRAISQADSDFFIASLQTKGQGLVSQDGRDAMLAPGEFCIYDSTRPYRLQFAGDFEQIVLKLNRQQVCAWVRDTEKLTATTVSGRTGAGQLLISMVNTLRTEVDSLTPASTAAVAFGVVNVLVAGIQSLPACSKADLSAMSAYHVGRIKQCIDQQLKDPGLTIESVAGRLSLSVGHVHRLFKGEPLSPSQYLWYQRLQACSRELLDPRRAKASVAEVAFGWGFNDAAHFSRAFRECFDCSPREWRRGGQGDTPLQQANSRAVTAASGAVR